MCDCELIQTPSGLSKSTRNHLHYTQTAIEQHSASLAPAAGSKCTNRHAGVRNRERRGRGGGRSPYCIAFLSRIGVNTTLVTELTVLVSLCPYASQSSKYLPGKTIVACGNISVIHLSVTHEAAMRFFTLTQTVGAKKRNRTYHKEREIWNACTKTDIQPHSERRYGYAWHATRAMRETN